MPTALLILIPALILAVAVALFLGVRAFVKTDERGVSDGRRQNRLMRWRIGLQFAAVIVIMIALWMAAR